MARVNIRTSLVLNVFICNLFLDDIDIDLTNYVDDTTPYAYDLGNGKVVKLLEKKLG